MKEVEIDFEILREPWQKYSVEDGSYVKSRFVITKFKKREPTTAEERLAYGFEGQNIVVAYNVPPERKGTPSTETYSPEQLADGAQEMRYTIVSEEWNEYVLEDGATVRIKNNVTSITRTNKFDRNGDPIYVVNNAQIFGLKPMKGK